jgi:hypothetical protein
MLSSRSDRTSAGKSLSVEVAYPRRYVLSRLVRGLTLKSTIAGALLGLCHGAYQHSSNQHPERGGTVIASLATGALAGASIGAIAGLSGSLAYAFIGGPIGVLTGAFGATVVAGGTYSAIPSIAAMPVTIAEKGKAGLGYYEPVSTAIYTPVLYDATIKEEAPPPAPMYNGPWNDSVVFLGMNPGPTAKAVRLMKRRANVVPIYPSLTPDSITVNGQRFDLRVDSGINAFVKSLALPPKQSEGVRKALVICEKGARDELAQLAQIWARGEKGASIPSRLVLAGHSNGDGVWGDDNGSLRLGPLLQLSRALPHAAVQIEDAFVTGCYSGGEVTMDQYLLIFPRARTIWAYEAQAPGVDNGATVDQGRWELHTRGRNATYIPTSSANAAKKMAVWSAKTGYHATKPPLTLAELRGKVQWMEENFYRPALAGRDYAWDGQWKIPLRITDPHTGLIRQYYSWLVRLTQFKGLPEEERPYWVEKKHQTIRLLYYSTTVAPRFAKNYNKEIRGGYSGLNLAVPDFSRMTRLEALQSINQYIFKLEKTKNAKPISDQTGTLLERGIKDLDPSVIPDGWV